MVISTVDPHRPATSGERTLHSNSSSLLDSRNLAGTAVEGFVHTFIFGFCLLVQQHRKRAVLFLCCTVIRSNLDSFCVSRGVECHYSERRPNRPRGSGTVVGARGGITFGAASRLEQWQQPWLHGRASFGEEEGYQNIFSLKRCGVIS